jgi:hypothetical protein
LKVNEKGINIDGMETAEGIEGWRREWGRLDGQGSEKREMVRW